MNENLSTSDLLNAWRDATRAAELAERLAALAADAAEAADRNALASEEIAAMAEEASLAAERAFHRAREIAAKARELAGHVRGGRLGDADATLAAARQGEVDARDRYHQREVDLRKRDGR